MISSGVAFIGNDHPFSDPGRTIQEEHPSPPRSVRLGGDNLIGHGTIVIGDVSIGRGVIVGAGSLVTHDLPPNTICVGRPARPVRGRYEESA
ncbi:acyltransferase [Pseudarthrobacter sp. NS4]|uniref:acyltransferase n=1 Tax=Pseudarthrobacter sp. NS4 TaxID=2973976 RepID=UPI0037C5942D